MALAQAQNISVETLATDISNQILSRFFPAGFSNSDVKEQVDENVRTTEAVKSLSLTSIRLARATETFARLLSSNKSLFGGMNLSELVEDLSPRINSISTMIDESLRNILARRGITFTGTSAAAGEASMAGFGFSGAAGVGMAAAGAGLGALDLTNIQPADDVDTSSITSEIPEEGRAILAAISAVESSDAYNIINYEAVARGSPKFFEDYSKHPFEGQKGYTAAGRYQILASNYEKYAPMAGVSDFSPASQDKVAWVFAQDVYQRLTKRDLSEDVRNEEMHPQIISTLGPTWHGLRDNPSKAIAVLRGAVQEGDESMAPPNTIIYPQTTTEMIARTPYQTPKNFSTDTHSHPVRSYNMESPKRAARIQQMSQHTIILPVVVNN